MLVRIYFYPKAQHFSGFFDILQTCQNMFVVLAFFSLLMLWHFQLRFKKTTYWNLCYDNGMNKHKKAKKYIIILKMLWFIAPTLDQ